MDPDPAIFVIDLQDANKKLIFSKFFCLLLFEGLKVLWIRNTAGTECPSILVTDILILLNNLEWYGIHVSLVKIGKKITEKSAKLQQIPDLSLALITNVYGNSQYNKPKAPKASKT